MEQRTGRLGAFLKSGPVQFVGVAGLAVVVGMGFNTTIENANGVAQPTTETVQQGLSMGNGPADKSQTLSAGPTDNATVGQQGNPVVDTATRGDKRIERPHVPQDSGTGIFTFSAGLYDWQTFAARSNDLAPMVTSAYTDDKIRALPTAADRAAVLGTGPHKLLHDHEGKALSPIYITQHYHLGVEGLAVAVSDNPVYEHTPIRAVAKNADLLAQAQTIGRDTNALRALVTEVHTARMGPEKALALDDDLKKMNKGDLATYAMVAGETGYVMGQIEGGPKDAEKAALLMMAGVEAHYESTRSRGLIHDFPINSGWQEQIDSANSVERSKKVEAAKISGDFKGLQAIEAPVQVAETHKPTKASKSTDQMR